MNVVTLLLANIVGYTIAFTIAARLHMAYADYLLIAININLLGMWLLPIKD